MNLTGKSIIGFRRGGGGGATLTAFNPATGESLMPHYHSASVIEVNEAAELADKCFSTYGRLAKDRRAAFLRQIADNIEALGEILVNRAVEETGLPAGRIQSERGRTCLQLRFFADLVEEGSWVDGRIDGADPSRKPLPKPDVRSMQRPIGPVVVFCASNFPLAFSVAGGDTASALAAGNPVIVNAHYSHPGTAELMGTAIRDAAASQKLPEGVFTLLFGVGQEVGRQLVAHPLVKAVGFTGSRLGGTALMKIAAARPEPIPFYGEMSSINPVFILPGALQRKREQITTGLHASVTAGVGQFCTNPGVVLVANDAQTAGFIEGLSSLMEETNPAPMLNPHIHLAYKKNVSAWAESAAVRTVVQKAIERVGDSCLSGPALFETDAATYLKNPELHDEVFGPSTLIVKYSGREELIEMARTMEGNLTATIHGAEQELSEFADLVAILESKVGRIIFNGFPTGVEVCHAMVHGGPYPSTSDGKSTSVGSRAIFRFTRPVCYQDFPQAALPLELWDSNPFHISRLLNGRITREIFVEAVTDAVTKDGGAK